MTYQLCTEIFTFLGMFILAIIPINRNHLQILVIKIYGLSATFVYFVIQPLFYLISDVNFRSRFFNHGLWKALKKELFSDNWRTSLWNYSCCQCESQCYLWVWMWVLMWASTLKYMKDQAEEKLKSISYSATI